jgi:hypothetical protein
MTSLHYKISKQAQSELTDVVGLFYLLTNGYAKMKLENGLKAKHW